MGQGGVKNLAKMGRVFVLFLSIRIKGLELEWREGRGGKERVSFYGL